MFIDDRPDERELVASAHPELHVMDATSDRVWRRLDLWSRLLPSRSEMDRTKLYQERGRRQAFLDDLKSDQEDEGKALAQLGVRVSLRDAKDADLSENRGADQPHQPIQPLRDPDHHPGSRGVARFRGPSRTGRRSRR